MFPRSSALPGALLKELSVSRDRTDSAMGAEELRHANSAQKRKITFSEISEVAFDPLAVRGGVFTEGTDNFSQIDSAQSACNTSSIEKSNCGTAATTISQLAPFDPVMMPYVNSLPTSISQHSIFTLPKLQSISQKNKKQTL